MTQAIFLSYASQDADAARRICEAMRAVGLEVWFDRSELRGGDAWDASIRKQIRECALFVPMISASTNARSDGYFRLEWKLAENWSPNRRHRCFQYSGGESTAKNHPIKRLQRNGRVALVAN